MSYNEISINGQPFKGYQGLGFGGVAPTVVAGTVNTDNTAPFDGICVCWNRGVNVSHKLYINGVDIMTIGGDSTPNMYCSVSLPVCKGATCKLSFVAGTVYDAGIKFVSY